MPFILPELLIESVIRDGLANITLTPAVLDDVFGSLVKNYNIRKYGQAEINKIKTLITTKQIPVVHNLADVRAHNQSFSIQLGMDTEDQSHAMLDDFSEDMVVPMTSAQDLQDLILVENVVGISYNPNSGQILIDNSTDLTNAHKNNIFVDASNIEFKISTVIKDGSDKSIYIDKNQVVDLSDFGTIKSAINYRQYEEKTVVSDEQLIIGVHAKDALTTKYLYVILKYILVSRKYDLIRRGFAVSSYSGSDFTRDLEFQGDHVYSRFLTITGKIEESWRANEVIPFDELNVQVLVPKDEATAEDLGQDNSTIKPAD
jgi:hypothetical protein